MNIGFKNPKEESIISIHFADENEAKNCILSLMKIIKNECAWETREQRLARTAIQEMKDRIKIDKSDSNYGLVSELYTNEAFALFSFLLASTVRLNDLVLLQNKIITENEATIQTLKEFAFPAKSKQ